MEQIVIRVGSDSGHRISGPGCLFKAEPGHSSLGLECRPSPFPLTWEAWQQVAAESRGRLLNLDSMSEQCELLLLLLLFNWGFQLKDVGRTPRRWRTSCRPYCEPIWPVQNSWRFALSVGLSEYLCVRRV